MEMSSTVISPDTRRKKNGPTLPLDLCVQQLQSIPGTWGSPHNLVTSVLALLSDLLLGGLSFSKSLGWYKIAFYLYRFIDALFRWNF